MKLAQSWACASVSVVLAVVALVNEPARAADCVYVGLLGDAGDPDRGVAVIDPRAQAVVARISPPEGGGVGGSIMIDGTQLRAYLLAREILVADLRTNTIGGTIPFPPGIFPGDRAILSPDGLRLYDLGQDTSEDSRLIVVDVMTGTGYSPPLSLRANSGDPTMAITPDGKFLYVARQYYGLSVVDTTTFAIVASVSGYPPGDFARSVVMAPDGKRAYTVDPYNIVSVIDTTNNAVVDRIHITHCRRSHDVDNNCGTAYLAVSPDSRYVYVVNYLDESIGAIDTRTNTELEDGVYPVRLGDPTNPDAPPTGHPLFIAVSPDGQTLAVTHDYFDRDRSGVNFLAHPNFLWIVQGGVPVRVSFSSAPNPVFFSEALAIASVPGGCAGAPIACVGDCDGLGTVTVDELVEGVTMALGEQPVATCFAFDANRDDAVTVDELVRAVHNALNGCTAEPQPR
jgi:DNA-binding beta-propeller fold protein YncE